MGLLTLEAIGPKAEQIALAAGDATGIPVGYDPEFECATFDSELDGEELERSVLQALADADPDWAQHLRIAE